MLATLRYGNATAAAPGPSSVYGHTLTTVLSSLNGAVSSAHQTLTGAHTPAGQAAAAERIAGAYGRAARALTSASPDAASEVANEQLTTSLGKVSAGYRALASAARGNDAGGYASARGQIAAAVAAVQHELAQLKQLGYTLG
jgi:hypothetical protein